MIDKCSTYVVYVLPTWSHLLELPYKLRWGALADQYCVYALAAMVRAVAPCFAAVVVVMRTATRAGLQPLRRVTTGVLKFMFSNRHISIHLTKAHLEAVWFWKRKIWW